jgi:hypothetical protein
MTLLERAARAYHDATRQFRYIRDPLRPDEKPVGQPMPFVEWDDLDDETKAERVNQVRAVLTAIREPSEGMKVAGGENIVHSDEQTEPDTRTAADVWASMIDAALSEGMRE